MNSNILKLLKADHKVVAHLLSELSNTTERAVKTRAEGLEKLSKEFLLHAHIEETIFYPVLKEYPKLKDLILEAYEEHHVAENILAELNEVDTSDETWGAKLEVLKENIEHHVDEEENNLFPKVEKEVDPSLLEEMGKEMEKIKAKA